MPHQHHMYILHDVSDSHIMSIPGVPVTYTDLYLNPKQINLTPLHSVIQNLHYKLTLICKTYTNH
jgi:hypothetical protein